MCAHVRTSASASSDDYSVVQIVVLLRRGGRTVEELAVARGPSDNAVRNHLSTRERDLLIQQAGVGERAERASRRCCTNSIPTRNRLFSWGYPPVLTAVIETSVSACEPDEADRLLGEVGHRLARQSGDKRRERWKICIRARSCPLSAAVSKQPGLCRAVEALVADVTAAHTKSRCENGVRPRCCFAIEPGLDERQACNLYGLSPEDSCSRGGPICNVLHPGGSLAGKLSRAASSTSSLGSVLLGGSGGSDVVSSKGRTTDSNS